MRRNLTIYLPLNRSKKGYLYIQSYMAKTIRIGLDF